MMTLLYIIVTSILLFFALRFIDCLYWLLRFRLAMRNFKGIGPYAIESRVWPFHLKWEWKDRDQR